MQSRKVTSVIAQAKLYNIRPSEVLFIEDEYTAYCFDEACALIRIKLENGEEPIFRDIETKKHYSSYSELIKDVERNG